ncbi:Mitochondrial outer membrane protein porin of 34 kDa [Capsicum chinense]|nr:Mitochondrial outer membrane protein porin of 34 kDa [Capsicum chinense]
MGKGPGLYSDIGKKARGLKKGDPFLADVNTQLKNNNITADVKVDSSSNLFTTITIVFYCPSQLEVQYLYDYAATSTEIGLNANPFVNFSGVVGTDVLSLGTDVSFDTNLGTFSKCNAGLSFTYNNGLVTSFNLNNKGDTLSTSYYCALSRVNDTAVGMEMTHSCSTNEDTFTIGIKHQLNELSTVKASLNSFGKVTTLFQLEWSPNSLFALSGEIDTKAVNKGGKYGLAVDLKL